MLSLSSSSRVAASRVASRAPRSCVWPIQRARVQALKSIDPLEAETGPYKPGKVFHVHNPEDLASFLDQSGPYKGRLVVLMCKASHCRPCKSFAFKYHQLAERFSDCVLLDITGDESKESRKMMMDMKVKATPSFFIYRAGVEEDLLAGVINDTLKNTILSKLAPEEAGRNWVEPVVSVDDDDEDDD